MKTTYTHRNTFLTNKKNMLMKMITIISAVFFMALDSMHNLLPLLLIFHLNFQFLYEMPHLVKFLSFSSCLIIPDHSKPGSCGSCEFALILITEFLSGPYVSQPVFSLLPMVSSSPISLCS